MFLEAHIHGIHQHSGEMRKFERGLGDLQRHEHEGCQAERSNLLCSHQRILRGWLCSRSRECRGGDDSRFGEGQFASREDDYSWLRQVRKHSQKTRFACVALMHVRVSTSTITCLMLVRMYPRCAHDSSAAMGYALTFSTGLGTLISPRASWTRAT